MNDKSNNKKKIVYVDMDNVLVNFKSGIERLSAEDRAKYDGNFDDCPGIFSLMDPMPGAVEAYRFLHENFDTYILSTSPWENHSAASEKLEWVKKHLGREDGEPAYKRLILSHHKNLNKGDFLIDDRTMRGADQFEGELIHFDTERFPDWASVVNYLKKFGQTATIEDAISIAAMAHKGIEDKAGAPYIFHPLRMMFKVNSTEAKIAAVLHDVVEDTSWTLKRLRDKGFSDEVVEAVDCLTRRDEESYDEFVERVEKNPIAREVKIADLEDNMNVRRIGKILPRDLKRLEKYHRAWTKLNDVDVGKNRVPASDRIFSKRA